jgi:phosphate transport system substrate-binding protein
VNWPVGLGGKGNEGVAATVGQTPGSIGYVELAYAGKNKLAYGALQNSGGKFINPTLDAVTSALASAMKTMDASTDFRVSITDAPGPDAYPIASMTYLLLHKTYDDPTKAKALVNFVWWGETVGQNKATSLGYAPLPEALRPWIQAKLRTITAGGQAVWAGSATR